jgi:catechol 2,3-dioxygenase-like lactoylglutathione lyase family enzyme
MMDDRKMAQPRIVRTSFVLAVPNIERTARWWTEAMGFERWMEPEGWIFVRSDDCSLMLGECPDAIPPADLGDHGYFAYLYVDDVDAVHARLVAHGADILSAPDDRPWGMREMAVRTPDGHRFMVATDLDA